MALRISTALRNLRLDTFGNAGQGVDFDEGTLTIYTGSQPESADDAPSGTILAQIALPADAFEAAANGVMAKKGTWQDMSADATGTAGWFRLAQDGDAGDESSSAYRIDGAITGTGGGGEMELDNTSIAAGQQITVNTFTLTEPAGAS